MKRPKLRNHPKFFLPNTKKKTLKNQKKNRDPLNKLCLLQKKVKRVTTKKAIQNRKRSVVNVFVLR
jgi:hypothetical protein